MSANYVDDDDGHCTAWHDVDDDDDDGGGGPSVTSTAWPTSTTVTSTTSACTDWEQTTDLLIVRFDRLGDAMNVPMRDVRSDALHSIFIFAGQRVRRRTRT